MKKLLLLLPLLCWQISTAQMKYSQDNGIYWQRVVECPELSSEQIKNSIKSSGVILYSDQIINDTEKQLTFNAVKLPSKSSDLKLPAFTTPFFYNPNIKYKGRVIYDISNGRYRVSFYNIMWYQYLPNGELLEFELTKYIVKKNGEFRKIYNDEALNALDYTFSKNLIFVQTSANDDW